MNATTAPAVSALRRVRELHRHMNYDGLQYCDHCIDHIGPEWPCPTIRALDNT